MTDKIREQIERFDLESVWHGHRLMGEMHPNPNGKWVRFCDVEKLLADREKRCAWRFWPNAELIDPCVYHEHAMDLWARRELDRLENENIKLKAVVGAAREMATDYEAYEYQRNAKDYNQPIHDPDILARWETALAELDKDDD